MQVLLRNTWNRKGSTAYTRAIARAIRESGREVVIVGSGDLSHLGPGFGREPPKGERLDAWERTIDAPALAAVESLDAIRLIDAVRKRMSKLIAQLDPAPPAASYTQLATAAGAVIFTIIAALMGNWLGRRITYFLLCIASFAILEVFLLTITTFGPVFLTVAFLAGGITAAFYGWLPLYLPELFPTAIRATGRWLPPGRCAAYAVRAGPSSNSPAAATPPPTTKTPGSSSTAMVTSPTPSQLPTSASSHRAIGHGFRYCSAHQSTNHALRASSGIGPRSSPHTWEA